MGTFLWPTSGTSNLGTTVCDFRIPETCLPSMGDRLLYAFPSGAPQGDLDRKKSFLSDKTELYDLINEEFPDSMSFLWGS